MARLVLLKDWQGNKAGDVIDVDRSEASALVLRLIARVDRAGASLRKEPTPPAKVTVAEIKGATEALAGLLERSSFDEGSEELADATEVVADAAESFLEWAGVPLYVGEDSPVDPKDIAAVIDGSKEIVDAAELKELRDKAEAANQQPAPDQETKNDAPSADVAVGKSEDPATQGADGKQEEKKPAATKPKEPKGAKPKS